VYLGIVERLKRRYTPRKTINNNLLHTPLGYISLKTVTTTPNIKEGIMLEVWKEVKGYEGIYKVSSTGRVKSLKRKGRLSDRLLRQRVGSSGYPLITLSKNSNLKTKPVHQVMAEAFLNHIPCGMDLVVDHINNISTDNRLCNLQIIRHRENLSKDKNGTSKYPGVYWSSKRNRWVSTILIGGKRRHLGSFVDEQAASRAYNNAL